MIENNGVWPMHVVAINWLDFSGKLHCICTLFFRPKLLTSETSLEPVRTVLQSTDKSNSGLFKFHLLAPQPFGTKLLRFHLLHPVYLLMKRFKETMLVP